jgi:VanZ family protein
MNRLRYRIRRCRPAMAGMGLIGVAVLSLGPDVNPGSGLVDRLSHAAAYAVLAIVVLMAGDRHGPNRWSLVLLLGVGLAVFGSLLELAQTVVHRDAAVLDGLADAIGVAVGTAVYSIGRTLNERRLRSVTAEVASAPEHRPSGGPASS